MSSEPAGLLEATQAFLDPRYRTDNDRLRAALVAAEPWIRAAEWERVTRIIQDLPVLEKGTNITGRWYADADFVRLDDVVAAIENAAVKEGRA